MNYSAARMTLLPLMLCGVLSPVFGQVPARPGRGAGPQTPQVVSPEISADRKVTFRILAPKAEKVGLGSSDIPGIGFGAPKDLVKGTNDIWEATIGPINPGAYRYNFSVDGVPVIDPRNPLTSESNENTWSLVYVPGAEFMDTREVSHGAISELTYGPQRFGASAVFMFTLLPATSLEKGNTRFFTCCMAHSIATPPGAPWVARDLLSITWLRPKRPGRW